MLLLRLDFQIIVGDLAWRKCVAPIAPATYRVSEWAEVSRRLNTNRRIDHNVFAARRLPPLDRISIGKLESDRELLVVRRCEIGEGIQKLS